MSKLKIILLFLLFLLISLFFSISAYLSGSDYLVTSSFIINFLGVLLGISITLITYIHTIVSSVQNRNDNTVSQIFIELKHNTYFVFLSFVIAILIKGIEKLDFPLVSMGSFIKYKVLLVDIFRNFILFTSLFTVYDILGCLFRLLTPPKE
jgi:hypothetical protein